MTDDKATWKQLTQKHAKHGILIDTNILLLALIGETERRLIQSFKRTQSLRYTPFDFDLLIGVTKQFSRVITTAHILAEVSNLGWQLTGAARERFATILRQAIVSFAEQPLAGASLVEERYFTTIGVTDSGILQMARRGFLVLTDDGQLFGKLMGDGLDVLNLNHLRLFFH